MIQCATVTAKIIANLINQLGLVTGSAPLNYEKDFVFQNGVGNFQAEEVYSATRTLAAGGNSETLSLNGAGGAALADAFGNAIALTAVKAIIISSSPNNADDIHVGAAASDQFAGWLGTATDYAVVKPGGVLMLIAPNGGYPVAAAASNLLKIADAAEAGVTYDLVILGY